MQKTKSKHAKLELGRIRLTVDLNRILSHIERGTTCALMHATCTSQATAAPAARHQLFVSKQAKLIASIRAIADYTLIMLLLLLLVCCQLASRALISRLESIASRTSTRRCLVTLILSSATKAKADAFEQRTHRVVGDNKRTIDADHHENDAARVREEIGEKRVQATRQSGQGANLPLKAEASERVRGADKQYEHVVDGQVEEKPERGSLTHRTLREDDYVERVAYGAHYNYHDQRGYERFDQQR